MAEDWPDRRITDLFGIELPILQAPMAGAQGSALTVAVSNAGGLGALPCAMLSVEQVRAELSAIRKATLRPFALNFFCHRPPVFDAERDTEWRARMAPYYAEMGIDLAAIPAAASRRPFDEAACDLVEQIGSTVVSFHFGLPEERLLERVRATGAKVVSSATTVSEARWLEERGCDAIIAQGAEAGGHRGRVRGRRGATASAR
ncbi:nitronate monooxygenase, partial [bacterium]